MTASKNDQEFLQQAVDLARQNAAKGGRPFGAVVVRDNRVIATGVNDMHHDCDPTAHAELQALRQAGRELGQLTLTGCTLYASGHPCAMCMGALVLANVSRVVYAAGEDVGRPYGLMVSPLYDAMARPVGQQGIIVQHYPQPEMADIYASWHAAQA